MANVDGIPGLTSQTQDTDLSGATARPIFVVGSPRSGTSILTWSLGHHPNILVLEETGWFGKLAGDLLATYAVGSSRGPRSQLNAMGITREAFFTTFGEAVNRLILDHRAELERRAELEMAADSVGQYEDFKISRSPSEPKQRWVDGTPENSLFIYPLIQLFPRAKFIHLLRDVRSVMRSLLYFHTIGGPRYSPEAAYSEWLRNVRACVEAERVLGSERVLRIRHADLTDAREATIRRCLHFVGEPFSEYCVRTLETRINQSATPAEGAEPTDADPALVEEAEELSRALLAEELHYPPDPEAIRELGQRFVGQALGSGCPV